MAAIETVHLYKRFHLQKRTWPRKTLKTSLFDAIRGTHASNSPDPSEVTVLDDINLKLEAGWTYGVIGRNGSGKSTLLRLLAHIYKPDSGIVCTQGRILPLLGLGAGFHPELTGRENVLINGILLGLSSKEIQACMDHIIQFAEMDRFIDEPIRTYSAGMHMRLGFSVAVHAEPDIILIDEVLAVGDNAFQKKCYDKIAEFQRKGKTLVIVSHELAALEHWCQQIIWLDNGVVRMHEAPKQVVSAYRDSLPRPTTVLQAPK